jgi:small subunit ribosomal protein S6
MNIECDQAVLEELESAFRFNDAVLRHLTLTCKAAVTEKSAMMQEVEREESAKSSDRKSAVRSDDAAADDADKSDDDSEDAAPVVAEAATETADAETSKTAGVE